jgi:hypothetical protein
MLIERKAACNLVQQSCKQMQAPGCMQYISARALTTRQGIEASKSALCGATGESATMDMYMWQGFGWYALVPGLKTPPVFPSVAARAGFPVIMKQSASTAPSSALPALLLACRVGIGWQWWLSGDEIAFSLTMYCF